MPESQLNESKNRLVPLDGSIIDDSELIPIDFCETDFDERHGLQELLVKYPHLLGEPLQVIQKEFNRFVGTNIRLDILAIDKLGRLVVIENKLKQDRRVVGQALNYAAYCSKLSEKDIKEIYNAFLWWPRRGEEDANAKLCQFFGPSSPVNLNAKKTQRLVLVATDFSSEVLASVRWLRDFDLHVQCFHVIAYRSNKEHDKIYIKLEPKLSTFDVPLPRDNVNDYTESLRPKKECPIRPYTEKEREFRRFCGDLLESFSSRGLPWSRDNNTKIRNDNMLDCCTAVHGCAFQLKMLRSKRPKPRMALGLNIWSDNRNKNERIYDFLKKDRDCIDCEFNHNADCKLTLDWQRLEGKTGCKIVHEYGYDSVDEENWQNIIEWSCNRISKFKDIFCSRLEQFNVSQ